jgi:hypothetical protein
MYTKNHFPTLLSIVKSSLVVKTKTGKSSRYPINRIVKPATQGVTRMKLGNLIDNFKTYIINTFSIQLDTLKMKRKQEEESVSLAIFCPRCRKRHPKKEFPFNVIEFYGIFLEYHPTERCPSLPGLQDIYKGRLDPQDPSYPPKILWRQKNPNMFPDPCMQYPQQKWVPLMPYS